MENLQRELEKEIASYSPPKAARKSRRWKLLLVGEHGEIVSVSKFKSLAAFVVILLLVSLILCGFLVFLMKDTHEKSHRLQTKLTLSEESLESMAREKDLLTARLIVAESKISELADLKSDDGKNKSAIKEKKEPLPDKSASADKRVPDKKTERAAVTPEKGTNVSVAVADYSISKSGSSGIVKVNFIVKNTSEKPGAISGRIFSVLKPDPLSTDGWIVLPRSGLSDKRPSDPKRGQFFSITRYKTVRFSYGNNIDLDGFTVNTIYIYSSSGELMLEQSFPLRVDAASEEKKDQLSQ